MMIPAHTSEPYQGTGRTVEVMEQAARGPRGEQSLPLRLAVEDIIRWVSPRDRLSQIAAMYRWFAPRYTFVPDPWRVELIRDPERILADIVDKGRFLGDCDDASVFLVSALRTIGIPSGFARVRLKRDAWGREQLGGDYTHVLGVAHDQFGRRIVLDPVAGAKTREMLSLVGSYAITGLGGPHV